MAKISAPTALDDTTGLYNTVWSNNTDQWQSLGLLEVVGLVRLAPVTLEKVAKRPEPTFTKVVIPPAM